MLRRHTWRWLAIAAIAALTTAAAPASASAASTFVSAGRVCPPNGTTTNSATAGVSYCGPLTYRTASIDYVGFAYLNLNYCAPGTVCTMVYRTSMNALRWTGQTWVSGQLPGGWTWVQPGGGGWRFAYSYSARAWFAVTTGRFEIRG